MTASPLPAVTTAEELLDLPDDGWRYELVRGELLRMTPASYEHAKVTITIGAVLAEFVRARDLGDILGGDPGFTLARNPDTVRAPDVAFVAADRRPADGPGFPDLAPDLAVEVVSPNDRAGEIAEKVQEWLDAGCRAVWVAHPKLKRLVVHHPDGTARMLGPEDELDGGDVLPGFRVTVAELFA